MTAAPSTSDRGAALSTEPATTLPPFEEVYRANLRPVYLFCLSQVGQPSDAEDLASEVFTDALNAYARTSPGPEAVRPWLMRIARNAVIDFYRRTARRSDAMLRLFRRSGSDFELRVDVENEVIARDELRFVLDRIGSMNPRERVLVGLRIAGDLSYAEIGATLGISEHAATMATRRAIQRLRVLCARPT